LDAKPKAPVAVAVGSNLGDRRSHLAFAFQRLSELLEDLRVSSIRETDPVGVPGHQPRFLNAAAVGTWRGEPEELLSALLAIEAARGRQRLAPLAARTLDLDLILFDQRILQTANLITPHPRFRERRFVLEPLAELVPEWKDPVTGRTVAELWEGQNPATRGQAQSGFR
jgi:2-amino-4-hydroxy-6-hydroxymethyldihydropteridine diphosphokinase